MSEYGNTKRIDNGQKLTVVKMDLRGDLVVLEATNESGFVFQFGLSVEYASQFTIGGYMVVEILPRKS